MSKFIKLNIQSLEIETIIGILPHERKEKQPLLINASLYYRYEGEFLDYLLVRDSLITILCQGKYGLIEDALCDTASKLFSLYPLVQKIKLALMKPNISQDCQISMGAVFKRKTFKCEDLR
ncbi:dihydroneopterin aldolase [Helicobacter aurati]|nr:dihydroneopterin aldolase [Helicobacter aurati]